MIYTHYWQRLRALPQSPFTAAVHDCRRLCTRLTIPLGDETGLGQPAFSDAEICFNGQVDSGSVMAVQRVPGLLWPGGGAHGIAMLGEPAAITGTWGIGPTVAARALGADGDGSCGAFLVERLRCRGYPQEIPQQEHKGQKVQKGQKGQAWWFGFCQTNYRPYDLCVQACLIILSSHLGHEAIRVASDGDSEDWTDARDACQHVLGFGIDWGEAKLAPVPPRADG